MNLELSTLKNLKDVYGDSFYILDLNRFKKNYSDLLSAFKSYYSDVIIGYSYKTNYTPCFCKAINEIGGYAEVVSEMEYDLALKIGVDPLKIIVNGPYKTKSALSKYFKNGSIVNLDSSYEIELLNEISGELPDLYFRVGLRCNFQLNNKYISRFGFDVESQDFEGIIHKIKDLRNIRIEGIHCHFPDRILDYYEVRVRKMLNIYQKYFWNQLKFIDIGGGYFGNMPEYLASQFNCIVPAYSDYARVIAGTFSEYFLKYPDIQKPTLVIEPGSAIVADTVNFVTRIVDIKKIGDKSIALTTGSKFNLGAFASTIQMPLEIYNDPGSENKFFDSIDISGYTCIESDYLYLKYTGYLGRNSYLVFGNVGSYSLVFKPPFILPNFPVIEYNEGLFSKVSKRQENMNDIFATFNFE